MDWTPAAIRALRGSRSRAEFAEMVGVTPLTVYRWELHEDAAESRRPRRGSRVLLQSLISHLDLPSPHAQPDAPEGPVVDATHLLADCRWADVERLALEALSSGREIDEEGRAFLQTCVARIQWLVRQESRSAFASLAPLLSRLGRIPPEAADQVHATAALLFAAPDGRVFDAVRSAAHAAQVSLRRAPDLYAMAWVGAAMAAWNSGDGGLFLLRLERAESAGDGDSVLDALLDEARAYRSELQGRSTEAIGRFEAVSARARELGLPPMAARCTGRALLLRLFEADHPDAILRRVASANRRLADAEVTPGEAERILGAAEAEAFFRRARYLEAEAAISVVRRVESSTDWPSLELRFVQARTTFHQGGSKAADGLLIDFDRRFGDRRLPAFYSMLVFLDALAAMHRGEVEGTLKAMEHAQVVAEALGTASWLSRLAALLSFRAATIAGHGTGQDRAATRSAELLDTHPAAWFGWVRDHLNGTRLLHQGRAAEALPILRSAAAALARAGDEAGAARSRRALALALWAVNDPTAEERLAKSARELGSLGMELTRDQQTKRYVQRASHAETPGPDALLTALEVPLRRIAMRGVAPDVLLREIRDAASTLIGCDGVRIVEASCDARSGSFADGRGRRWRIETPSSLSASLDTSLALLATAAGVAMERATLRSGDRGTPKPLNTALSDFVAASVASRALVHDLGRVADSDAPVLIRGEAGVGKQAVAKAVHRMSRRRERPYVTVDASTKPAELVTQQLFGFHPGALAGADKDSPGLLRLADGGTLLLHGLEHLPLPAQQDLLRFMQTGRVQPSGAGRPDPIDVRVISTTREDPSDLVRRGDLLETLYHHLQVTFITVQPLRNRPDDVLALAHHFLGQLRDPAPALAADAVIALRRHPWPGNARELRRLLQKSLDLASVEPRVLRASDLHL